MDVYKSASSPIWTHFQLHVRTLSTDSKNMCEAPIIRLFKNASFFA